MLHVAWSVLMLGAAGSPARGSESSVCIDPGGPHVALEGAAREQAASEIDALFASCSLNSAEHAQVFKALDPAAAWRAAAAIPHIYATRGGVESLIPLQFNAAYWFTRRGGKLVAHTKCSGAAVRGLLCGAAVRPQLPPAGAEQCRSLER